jgi:glycosyltransferase involved in cell wall biosynthesis
MSFKREVRLCLASHHFFPTHGGATLRFLRYLPGLRERGIETTVMAGTPKAKKILTPDITQEWYRSPVGEILPTEVIEGTPIHRVRLPEKAGWSRSMIFNRAVVRYCRQDGSRPDAMQLLSSLRPRSLVWLMRLRKLGIPTVYAYTSPPKLPNTPIRRARRKLASRVLYRQLNCVVAQSVAMERLLWDAGVRTRVEIIPNGVDLRRFHPATSDEERKALRAALGLGGIDRMIATVGTVTPRKGTDLLIEAWNKVVQRFPDTHVVIVGPLFDASHPVFGEFRRRIDRLITASNAAERVHFTGFVDNVEEYLRASDVFVLPTSEEGLPGAVLEAMASGVPVILTPFVGLPDELGKPGTEYLLIERKPEAIAAAIVTLLEDDDVRVSLGRRGRRWVDTTMDIERSLDRYAALYWELAEQGGPRSR